MCRRKKNQRVSQHRMNYQMPHHAQQVRAWKHSPRPHLGNKTFFLQSNDSIRIFFFPPKKHGQKTYSKSEPLLPPVAEGGDVLSEKKNEAYGHSEVFAGCVWMGAKRSLNCDLWYLSFLDEVDWGMMVLGSMSLLCQFIQADIVSQTVPLSLPSIPPSLESLLVSRSPPCSIKLPS